MQSLSLKGKLATNSSGARLTSQANSFKISTPNRWKGTAHSKQVKVQSGESPGINDCCHYNVYVVL